MARYKVLQTFDARHETFEAGTTTNFAHWKPNEGMFRFSALPQNGLDAAMAAAEKARLEDIATLVKRGLIEDLDKDELGADAVAKGPTDEEIAAAQRLYRIAWEEQTKPDPRRKGAPKFDDLLAERDVIVRLMVDPGTPPLFAMITSWPGADTAIGVTVSYEQDTRWYARDSLDLATRTFNGPGEKSADAFKKPAMQRTPRTPETAPDQPA